MHCLGSDYKTKVSIYQFSVAPEFIQTFKCTVKENKLDFVNSNITDYVYFIILFWFWFSNWSTT